MVSETHHTFFPKTSGGRSCKGTRTYGAIYLPCNCESLPTTSLHSPSCALSTVRKGRWGKILVKGYYLRVKGEGRGISGRKEEKDRLEGMNMNETQHPGSWNPGRAVAQAPAAPEEWLDVLNICCFPWIAFALCQGMAKAQPWPYRNIMCCLGPRVRSNLGLGRR